MKTGNVVKTIEVPKKFNRLKCYEMYLLIQDMEKQVLVYDTASWTQVFSVKAKGNSYCFCITSQHLIVATTRDKCELYELGTWKLVRDWTPLPQFDI